MDYYYLDESGKASGPVPDKALQALHASGLIHGGSLIAAVGAEQWVPYDSVFLSSLVPSVPPQIGAPRDALQPVLATPREKNGSERIALIVGGVTIVLTALGLGGWLAFTLIKQRADGGGLNLGHVVSASTQNVPTTPVEEGTGSNAPAFGGHRSEAGRQGGRTVSPPAAQLTSDETGPSLVNVAKNGGAPAQEKPNDSATASLVSQSMETLRVKPDSKVTNSPHLLEPDGKDSSVSTTDPQAEWYEFGFQQGKLALKVFQEFGMSAVAEKSQLSQLIRNLDLDGKDIDTQSMELCFDGYRDAFEGRSPSKSVARNSRFKSVLPMKLREYRFDGGSGQEEVAAYGALDRVLASTVMILTIDSGGSILGTGSGFFIAPGTIVTNGHVVKGATTVYVRLPDKTRIKGQLLGASNSIDLAVIRIENSHHPALEIGNVARVRVGDPITAVGFPDSDILAGNQRGNLMENVLKLNPTTTFGHVSNTEFEFKGNPCLQIDLTINHGNSGGPLVDRAGRVIGINTFMLGDYGVDRLNFAIKMNAALSFIKQHCPGVNFDVVE